MWYIIWFLMMEFLLIFAIDEDSPRCGLVTHVKFKILDDSSIDFTNRDSTYTANVTFRPIARKLPDVDYYIAMIGTAIKLDHDYGCFYGMNEVFAHSTNCEEMDTNGHCLTTTGNSLLISNLKVGYHYGIILCAIVNPLNRQLPVIEFDEDDQMPPYRVDQIYVPLQRNVIKMLSREGCIIFAIAALIDLIFLGILFFCCRFWHLRYTMKERPIRGRAVV